MTDNKNENIQTINLNLGVTDGYVNMIKAYLDAGAVDKEVTMKFLGIIEKSMMNFSTILATKMAEQSKPKNGIKDASYFAARNNKRPQEESK